MNHLSWRRPKAGGHASAAIDVYRGGGQFRTVQKVDRCRKCPLRKVGAATLFASLPAEGLQLMRKIFAWVTDDYDKIPAERVVMNDRELPGTVLPVANGV